MTGLKDWLMAVIGVSVLICGADSLIPPGGVKTAGRLVCGLVMVCVLLQPLSALRGVSISEWLEDYTQSLEVEEIKLEQQAGLLRKAVIEDYFSSYILDRGEGIEKVEVDCALQRDGLYLPVRARLWGNCSPVEQSRLTEVLRDDLDIPVEDQTYYLN